MKTEELVSLLASGLDPVNPRRARLQFPLAWALGIMGALALAVGVWRFNSPVPHEVSIGMFWVRGAFCSSLALGGFIAVVRLSYPGTRLGLVPVGLALPVLGMWALAVAALMQAPTRSRIPLVLGHTALVCPWLIAFLAAPLFVALIWAMRGFAPTRLRLAGAAAGLASGAGGALVYTLHCPELAAPFIGTWYLIGMLIPASLGAGLGPRLLRW